MINWLLWVTGVAGTSGRWYAWWSGFASDLGLFAAAGGLYWKHKCHVGRCPRIGRHPVDGTPYVVCRPHHPEGRLTRAKLEEHAAAAANRGEGE